MDNNHALARAAIKDQQRPTQDQINAAMANTFNKAYKQGYIDAISNYAIHKDGEQLVGCMQRPLKEVIAEVQRSAVPIRY